MKVKLLILFLVISVLAAGQSVVPIKGDSVIISKTGGWAELVVRNKTKDTINGLMINTGNGVMAFKRIRAINDSQFVIGTDTIKIKGIGSVAASNGLSKSGNTIVLGGSALTGNTSIPTSAFNLTIASSSASGVLTLTATGGPALTATTSVISSFAINGTSTHLTTGGGGAFVGPTYGATGTSVVGVGIYGQSTSDIGVLGSSTSGTGGSFTLNPSTTNAMDDVLRITRSSSGTPSVGLGASIAFWLESSTTTAVAGRMGFNWSVTTHAVRTSVFELYTINSGTLARKLKIAGNGLITMDTYIGTTHTGTLHKLAGFDASGNLIMVDTTGLGGGGSSSSDSLATLMNAPEPGEALLNTDAIDTLLIKRLIAGSNISLVATAYGITINSTGGGGGGGGDTLYVVNRGTTGITIGRASNDTLSLNKIVGTGAISVTKQSDSTILIASPLAILNGGNTTAAQVVVGTNDWNSFAFETNGTTQFTINQNGHLADNSGTVLPAGSSGITADTIWTNTLTVNKGSTNIYGLQLNGSTMIVRAASSAQMTIANVTTSGSNWLGARSSTGTTGSHNFMFLSFYADQTASTTSVMATYQSSLGYAAAVDTSKYGNLNGYYHDFLAVDSWRSLNDSKTPVGYQPFVNKQGDNHFNYHKGFSGFGLAKATPSTSKVDIYSALGYDQLRLRQPYTPTGGADANGQIGDIAWDNNYIYVKISTGWRRTAHSTW